jgi:hypothetical protein
MPVIQYRWAFSGVSGVAKFVGFSYIITAEHALQKAAGQAEDAENYPCFSPRSL